MSSEAQEMAAFVTARLDEWQAKAEAAAGPGAKFGVWDVEPYHDGTGESADLRARYLGNLTGPAPGSIETPAAEHIALHDPATTLLLVASLRAIMAEHLHAPVSACARQHGKPDFGCENCAWDREEGVYPGGWCVTVRQVAASWSTHPQYQESWKP